MKREEHMHIWKGLPAMKRHSLMRSCESCAQKGSGEMLGKITNFFKSMFSHPIAKEIATTVMKEVIMPAIKRKMAGNGLRLPGAGSYGKGCCGSGLKLPGSGLGLPGGKRAKVVTKTRTIPRRKKTIIKTRTVVRK